MENRRKLVVVISQGPDNERASVAWSMANGGLNAGLDVSVFLVSSGVEWARKGVAERAHLNPLDPSLKDMIQNVINAGAPIGVCPPCIKVRGIEESDLIDGVEVKGSIAVHGPISEGAAVLNF